VIDLSCQNLRIAGRQTVLRRFMPDDITPAYIGWLNDPAVVRFSNQRFRQHDRASCEAYLQSFDGSPNLFAAITEGQTGAMIGTMTAYAAVPHGTVDVGIMIGDSAVRGKGFGRDSWCAMVDWLLGVDGVRKVTAGTLACNIAMIRLMEAAGMEHEATRRAQEMVEGKPEDIVYYARFSGG
jgi:ribosomal-protein-alanine N-acetyltransferase